MSTVAEGIKSFLFHCQYEKTLSTKTLQAYQIDLNQFVAFLKEISFNGSIAELDRVVLRAYVKHIAHWKPKTIKRKIACIKAMFNFWEFEDNIPSNPFHKMRINIKEPRQLPVVMDQAEVHAILKKAYDRKSQIKNRHSYGCKEVLRDIAVLELLFATGIRVSELCHLLVSDVLLDKGLIRVIGKGRKERIIQLVDEEVTASLMAYRMAFASESQTCNRFFINRLGNGLSDQSVRYMVKQYSQIAKVQKHVTPHTFRHTFATLLLEEDVDITYIQHLLGHSSILTTQIYTHVNQEKQKQILTTKHPRKQFRLARSGCP